MKEKKKSKNYIWSTSKRKINKVYNNITILIIINECVNCYIFYRIKYNCNNLYYNI